MNYDMLLYAVEDRVATITLNRPERLNAFSLQLMDELVQAVATHPELLNRPIVVAPRGALLCRPPERVLELLD